MIHNFFENAITALIKDLYTKLKPFETIIQNQTFPILIMNTGDEVYLSNLSPDTGITVYQRVPRMVLDIQDMSINPDQLSNPNMLLKFIDEDINTGFKSAKLANMKRVPITFEVNARVYFSNVFEWFGFMEILLSTTYKNNVFDFYYLDKLMRASYNYADSFNPNTKTQLDFDSEKRQRTIDLQFNVELQYPAFDFYDSTSLFDATTNIQVGKHNTNIGGVTETISTDDC